MISFLPSVKALETAYSHFETSLFRGKLGRTVVRFHPRGRRSEPAWFVNEQWKDAEGRHYGELTLADEEFSKPPEAFCLSLVEGMIHQWGAERGIILVSREERYHNHRFADIAREIGLVVPAHPDARVGFARVRWGRRGSLSRSALDALVSKGALTPFALTRLSSPPRSHRGGGYRFVCQGPEKRYIIRSGTIGLDCTCNDCRTTFVHVPSANGASK